MAGGKVWTDEDNQILVEMKKEGRSNQDIADALGRTEASVTLQCSKLRVKKKLMEQQAVQAPVSATFDVEPDEEYSEEEIRAATRSDEPAKEPACVRMPVIPVGDGKAHPLGKLPATSSFVMLSRKEFDRSLRDAKTIKHTVEDLVSMLHSEENKKTEGILALGALLSDVNRLVEDLEEMKRSE